MAKLTLKTLVALALFACLALAALGSENETTAMMTTTEAASTTAENDTNGTDSGGLVGSHAHNAATGLLASLAALAVALAAARSERADIAARTKLRAERC
eukprot:CAMPEP_0170375994 /NCGR_PEP_ID=MMETSP0117_2-20130122/11464_1 /TAXON_ID=400756 /ORGANISM="Durinskia baltica, Strain CSIRO CS-38" /LENGTH=99 /DNA_ID=CAMNT_0010631119 /DNA_START=75 /DNA_END=372 /DNA_ORIENTATION=-